MGEFRDGIQLWDALRIVGLAALVGAVIGAEREWAGKPAGLRTHILVSAAASLFVVLGFSVVETFRDHEYAAVRSDPIRILQAIVIGVSFLGAGTILQDRSGKVEGLTTAASLLITASLGVAVALGHVGLAAAVTVGLVVLLFGLGRLEAAVARAQASRRGARSSPSPRRRPRRPSRTVVPWARGLLGLRVFGFIGLQARRPTVPRVRGPLAPEAHGLPSPRSSRPRRAREGEGA